MKKIKFLLVYLIIFSSIWTLNMDNVFKRKDGKYILIKENKTWEYISKDLVESVKRERSNLHPIEVISHNFIVVGGSKYTNPNGPEKERLIRLFLRFRNNTDNHISGIEYSYEIRDRFGKKIYRGKEKTKIKIAPWGLSQRDYKIVWKENNIKTRSLYKKLMAALEMGKVEIRIEITNIETKRE